MSSGNSTSCRMTNSRNSLMPCLFCRRSCWLRKYKMESWQLPLLRAFFFGRGSGGRRCRRAYSGSFRRWFRRRPSFCLWSCFWFGSFFRSGFGIFVFLDQTANCVRRLRTFTDPVFDAVELEPAVEPWLFRIVGADDLNKFPVPRAAFVRDDDFKIRAV